MALKDDINKLGNKAKDAIDNVKDSVNEASHRSAADAEQAKRDLAGDQMTPGEKASSVLNQAKNTIQGDLDAAKREARKNL
jgi:hypothetical protein